MDFFLFGGLRAKKAEKIFCRPHRVINIDADNGPAFLFPDGLSCLFIFLYYPLSSRGKKIFEPNVGFCEKKQNLECLGSFDSFGLPG